MTQSIVGVLDGLYSGILGVYAGSLAPDGSPVLATFEEPGQYQPAAIVAIMDTATQITRPTMGPNRSREMAAEVTVIVSVYVPGDQSAAKVATDSAFGLVTLLETYLRTSPNEQVGGASRDAWISKCDPVGSIAYAPSVDPNEPPVPTGRVTEVTVIVTALIRY
jgi:hypothetical protein